MQHKQYVERAMHGLFLILGLFTIGWVLLISIYLLLSGIPALSQIGLGPFLLGTRWAPTAAPASYGILPFLLTSLAGTTGAICFGVPIGCLTALYLSKIAPYRVRRLFLRAIDLLAGIPSVIYGLIGMIVLVPAIQKAFHLPDGASLLAAILVLSIMLLPSIINIACGALDAVPPEYEEASLALGTPPVETYFRVSIRAARSGLVTAVVLGIGRAIGEAMAVMMVAGNAPNLPGLFRSVRFLTTAVASEMSYAAEGSLQKQALFSIALVLFLFILLINGLLHVLLKKERTR